MKKVWAKRITTVFAAAACGTVLFACTPTDKEYFKNVSAYSFWDNKGSESIAQYKFYDVMDRFLSEGTIANGASVGADGKTRKVLFLGWDGTRADAMTNVFHDENNFDTNNYNYEPDAYSGLHQLKEQGGLYMAYAGGEKGTETEQQSSTCAGWTSELTGGWNNLHGVDTNDDVKRAEVDSIMLKYAKAGLHTGLAFDWGQYFDTTLQNEVKYLLENPATPMKLCDVDRTVAQSTADILRNEELKSEKDIRALSLDYYNKVAADTIHPQAKYDIATRDYLLERMELGDDFVGGIFHRPDTNGHTTGFGNDNGDYVNSIRNADGYLYQLLEAVAERERTENETWLVLVTADHGGSGTGHGMQVYEHRTIWVASNRKIDASYYGKNYDGMNENP